MQAENRATSISVATGNATLVGLKHLLAPLCFSLPEKSTGYPHWLALNFINTSLQTVPLQKTALRGEKARSRKDKRIDSIRITWRRWDCLNSPCICRSWSKGPSAIIWKYYNLPAYWRLNNRRCNQSRAHLSFQDLQGNWLMSCSVSFLSLRRLPLSACQSGSCSVKKALLKLLTNSSTEMKDGLSIAWKITCQFVTSIELGLPICNYITGIGWRRVQTHDSKGALPSESSYTSSSLWEQGLAPLWPQQQSADPLSPYQPPSDWGCMAAVGGSTPQLAPTAPKCQNVPEW